MVLGALEVDRASLQARFQLPVFCVSSIEFQRMAGLRWDADDEERVWDDVTDTQIPALQQHVVDATLSQRSRLVRQQLSDTLRFGQSLLPVLEDASGAGFFSRDCEAGRAALMSCLETLQDRLAGRVTALIAALVGHVDSSITPQLASGTQEAADLCMATLQNWGQGWTRGTGGAGGLHWATYKATVRRHGVFRYGTFKHVTLVSHT
jgi:hypothetical protein